MSLTYGLIQVADLDAITGISVAGSPSHLGLNPVRRDSVRFSTRRLHRNAHPRPKRNPRQRVSRQHETFAGLAKY